MTARFYVAIQRILLSFNRIWRSGGITPFALAILLVVIGKTLGERASKVHNHYLRPK